METMKPIKIAARKEDIIPMSTDEFIKAFGASKENSKFYHYTPEWLEKTLPFGFKEASNKMLQEYSMVRHELEYIGSEAFDDKYHSELIIEFYRQDDHYVSYLIEDGYLCQVGIYYPSEKIVS